MEPRPSSRGEGDGCWSGMDAGVCLQWSRGLPAAESRKHALSQRHVIAPSMEPRPSSRGEQHLHRQPEQHLQPSMDPRPSSRGEWLPGFPTFVPFSILQWSRGLPAAERRQPAKRRTDLRSLQWSRGLPAAESVGENDRVVVEPAPSMEPRPSSRGEGGYDPTYGQIDHRGLQWSRGLSAAESSCRW